MSKIITLLVLVCPGAYAMEQNISMELNVALDSLTISLHTLQERLEQKQPTLPKLIPEHPGQWPTINTDNLINFITPLYEQLNNTPKPKDRSPQGLDAFRSSLQKRVVEYITANTQKLPSVLRPSNPEIIAQFTQILTRMITSGLFEKLTYNEEKIIIQGKEVAKPTALSYCDCSINFPKRIAFNMALVYDIFKQFPDKTKELVYTTMGSGGLWQDYLAIQALIWAGYTNIHLNLIDLYYPDAWKLHQAQNLDTLHADFINKYILIYPEQIDLLKFRLLNDATQVHAKLGTIVALETHLYNNAYEYMARTKKYPFERTNVLVMVDAEVEKINILQTFPSLANVIRFAINDNMHTYAFLPRNQPILLYQVDAKKIYHDDHPLDRIQFEEAQQELIQLARTSGANRGYTPKFFLGLEGLPMSYPFYGIGPVPEDINRYAKFAIDVFITFQDMLFDALADNALVYTLYRKLADATYDTAVIEKVDVEAHKKIETLINAPELKKHGYEKVNLN